MSDTPTTDLAATERDIQRAQQPGIQSSALAERARAQTQSAMQVAIARPRSETRAAASLMQSCNRVRFAENVEYAFPRGGTTVTGPSIYLAREAKRCWGNMDSGWEVIDRNEDHVMVQGWAVDLETNTWQRFMQSVKTLQQRKRWEGGEQVTKWEKPDERDLVELIARAGAKVERNAILALIPPDIIDDAVDRSRETVGKATSGQRLPADPARAARMLASAFGEFGVTIAQLIQKFGKPLEQLTEAQREQLRGIYKSIASGETTPDAHFTEPTRRPGATVPVAQEEKLGALRDKLGGKEEAEDAEVEAPASEPEAAADVTVSYQVGHQLASDGSLFAGATTDDPTKCRACDGSGLEGEGDEAGPCEACGGSGVVA